MVNFDDLPVELALNILSYLPQHCLPTIAKVSARWKTLAFDPSLWTEVCIDSTFGSSVQHVRDILERATMIRKLDVSMGPLYLEVVASASNRFKLMEELAIPGRALSHASMPVILRNCESLNTVVLRGRDILMPADMRALEQLKCLKVLLASGEVRIDDDVFQQMCISCPHMQRLHFNSDLIFRRGSWEGLQHLRHLTKLSITRISTVGLLHASRNCGSLETLQITDVWNENEVSVAQALQQFRKLRVVSVFDNCGTDWFDSRFRTPGEIQDFDVPRLEMQEQHLTLLAESCRETLRSIAFSAKVLTPASLNTLYGCRALESIAIHDLCGEGLVLPKLIKLPNLVRAQLHIAVETTEAIRKLNSIVDILDTSSKGSARLELRLHCSSQSSQDDMIREVSLFKEFLALNTRLSAQHIRNIEEQCWRIKHSKIFWLPIGRITSRIVDTSFPVISKTLKHLILELSD